MIFLRRLIPITALCTFLSAESISDVPIVCAVSGNGKNVTVTVEIRTPHPAEMAIRTPDERTIWLQADHIPFRFPVTESFEEVSTFELNTNTRGSWFNDWGEPEIVSIFSVSGTYELIVAEDVSARTAGAVRFTCKFPVSF